MTDKPLVSVITPCYNSENYISKLLDSILSQSYPNIEFILVNDGSTDDTERIVFSYKQHFIDKGYSFKYLLKENGGQASAINMGLKEFSGDYLLWPDSDDWFTPDSIEKRVTYMEDHPSVGVLLSDVYLIKELDHNKEKEVRKTGFQGDYFDCLINNSGVFWAPVAYMVRSRMFIDSLPSKHIYESAEGQNIQMLLPIVYKYSVHHISEVLGYYLIRQSSHSHRTLSKIDELAREKGLEKIYVETINALSMANSLREKALKVVHSNCANKRFDIAYQIGDKQIVSDEYKNLKHHNTVSKGTRFAYLEICYPFIYKVICALDLG